MAHDERYERSGEFLDVLHRFWKGEKPVTHHGKHYRVNEAQLGLGYKDGGRPYIYISGASGVAQKTAIEQGDCWLRYGDTPEGLADAVAPVLAGGCRAGTRMQVLPCRRGAPSGLRPADQSAAASARCRLPAHARRSEGAEHHEDHPHRRRQQPGIGLQAACDLLADGHRLVLLGRDPRKGEAALASFGTAGDRASFL
ncbi:LLM class flavin-dependent oxidoreductase [Streptomyces sp. NPDC002088]|uniref:LLM class flavin-dependent oxidoreductase n=1 Tax=Streptomyces sp. NPDC002088 TaxID=3154665 RepID=UPI0033297ECD